MSVESAKPKREWTPERIASLSKQAALVLIGAVVLGLFAIAARLYYVAAVAAVIGLVLLIAWRFEFVLALYMLVAFVPWGRTPDLAVGGSGVGQGIYVSEAMLGFVLTIWFIRYLFNTLPSNRIPSGFYLPLAIYLCYSVLNVVHSYIFWDTHINRMYQYLHVNLIDLGFRFLSAGALIMVATTVSNRAWLRWMSLCIMVPGLYNLLNAFAGGHIPLRAPFWSLVAILPVGYCWAIVLDSVIPLWKRLFGALVVLIALVVILIFSISWVSGWLALLFCLLTITFIKSRKMFVLALLVTGIALACSQHFVHRNIIEESRQAGDFDRFLLLKGSWRYATTFPLGVGLGNYRSYNVYYGNKWGTTAYTSAHGTYAQHLSEMGIPGLVLFLAVLIGGFRWILRNYRDCTDPLSKIYLLAVLGQMAGIAAAAAIGDYIVPTYHNGGLYTFSATVYSWLYWGLAIAHVRICQNEQHGSIDINR